MSRELSIILLGVAVVTIPYLGVPASWRTLLLVLAGLALIVIGFLMRSQGMARVGKSSPYHPFVENDAALANDIQHEHKEGITSLN